MRLSSDTGDRYANLNFAANRQHSILRRETHEYCRRNAIHSVPDPTPDTPLVVAEEIEGTDVDRANKPDRVSNQLT